MPQANSALAKLQASLELNDVAGIRDADKELIEGYNRDDCASTLRLRDWLEELRARQITNGYQIDRPQPGDGAPNENITDWMKKINVLVETLTNDIPEDKDQRTDEQQARWVLANILDWHRRENKAIWWEFFRLADLSAEEFLDERAGISGLAFVGRVGGKDKTPIHRFSFPPQETELRGGESIRQCGGNKLGSIEAINFQAFTVDIKKRNDSAQTRPDAVFAHDIVDTQVLANSLVRIGEYVAKNGITGEGLYEAARDLLLRHAPRIGSEPIRHNGEKSLDAAVRLTKHFEGGVLPIQGPPGSGKTYTGARMICELVKQGKKVGITANSHKVIRNLLNSVIEAADELKIELQCVQKASEPAPPQLRLSFAETNDDVFSALGAGIQVAGGTVWLWALPRAFQSVDVLFVDEAAQMSLANVLAVSHAARTIVLLGDQQQLDQPMQGSHPEGTDVSALDHILCGKQTISADKGLFFEETWHLHRSICRFTSELFYEGKLKTRDKLEGQTITSTGPVQGTGLLFVPVEHSGNQNASREEAETVRDLFQGILRTGSKWTDRDGVERQVSADDILVITPYNAQVFNLQELLPGAQIGTVDKFQGQQAPIAIYSLATSSYADAPREMEFLYSLNRLNVATSRAKCISILVASPQIFEAECQTPRQVQLANAFCRFREMAVTLDPKPF